MIQWFVAMGLGDVMEEWIWFVEEKSEEEE